MKLGTLREKLLITCATVFVAALAVCISAPAADAQTSKAVLKTSETQHQPGRFEFRIAPVQLLARFYSFEFAYRLSKQWSLGPAAVAYDSPGNIGSMFGPTFHGAAFGLSSTYYVKSVATDSPYISVHAFHQSYTSYGHATRAYSERTGFRGDAVLGYEWRWNFMNLRSGLGVQFENENVQKITPGNLAGDPATIEISRDARFFPTIELKIGIEI